jgi:hypothetical protein
MGIGWQRLGHMQQPEAASSAACWPSPARPAEPRWEVPGAPVELAYGGKPLWADSLVLSGLKLLVWYDWWEGLLLA